MPSSLGGDQRAEVIPERGVAHAPDPESVASAADPKNQGRSILRNNEPPAVHGAAVGVIVQVHPEKAQRGRHKLDGGRTRKLQTTNYSGGRDRQAYNRENERGG